MYVLINFLNTPILVRFLPLINIDLSILLLELTSEISNYFLSKYSEINAIDLSLSISF